MKICIIGAGVLGLTSAYELAVRGHEVTVLDRMGPFTGASSRSFAWLNGNQKFPSSYHRLNKLGIEENNRLHRRLPRTQEWLHANGSILADFSSAREQTYATRLEYATTEDYPVRRIRRSELESLEPSIAWPDSLEEGLFYPTEGYLDNDILGESLLRALELEKVKVAKRNVAQVASNDEGATISFTEGGHESFDRLVIAAGAGSGWLAEASGFFLPLADLDESSTRTHSLLGLTSPVDIKLNRVLISNRINVRPRHDRRMWVQVPGVERRVEEGESTELLTEVGLSMEEELEWLFGQRVPIEDVIFSGRSFPEDGLPIIGFVDEAEKIYSNVTHSGMTLAALFAQLTANELEGGRSELLTDFRPARFKDGVVKSQDWDFIGKQ